MKVTNTPHGPHFDPGQNYFNLTATNEDSHDIAWFASPGANFVGYMYLAK